VAQVNVGIEVCGRQHTHRTFLYHVTFANNVRTLLVQAAAGKTVSLRAPLISRHATVASGQARTLSKVQMGSHPALSSIIATSHEPQAGVLGFGGQSRSHALHTVTLA
jgi:hypothetical protein